MVRLDVTQKVLRESIHQYLSTQPELASVKMKDLRTSLQNKLGIPIDKLKNADYKPLIEKFAAEYILPVSGKSSQQNWNILKSNEKSRGISSQNESGSNDDEINNGKKIGNDAPKKRSVAKQGKDKGARDKGAVLTKSNPRPIDQPQKPKSAEVADSAKDLLEDDSGNKSKKVKQGKFSQAELELVRSTIHSYCAANRVEPTSICRYFRSQGVVKKFVKSSQEPSSAIPKSNSSSSARDLLQDVEEDEDGQFSKNHQELYKLLKDILPHRKPPSLRQCVNRILLSEYLPKSKFTPAEEEKLLELVEEVGHQFTVIGRALGRRPDDCKQALIRLKRKRSGQFSFQEDQTLTEVVLEQLGLTELSAFPSSGISWVAVAKNMNEERTPLDYHRRWRAILSLNKSFNYPFASNSQEIFDNHCGKSRSKLSKIVENNVGKEVNTNEKIPIDSINSDLSRFPSSFKKRLLLNITIMEQMKATGELDDKGVNFSAIGRAVSNTATWALWKRIKKDLPESLLAKLYCLQEQLIFLLTVHYSTVTLQPKEEESVSSDSEAERSELYRNRQRVVKLRRGLNSSKHLSNESGDDSHSSDSDENGIDCYNERLHSAVANASERNNQVYRRRWKRKLAYYTDMYNKGNFTASELSLFSNSTELKGSSVATAVMMTLNSSPPATAKRKESKNKMQSSAESLSRPRMMKSPEKIGSQKSINESSIQAASVASISAKEARKKLKVSSDDNVRKSEAEQSVDESSQHDDNSSEDSALDTAKRSSGASPASQKPTVAVVASTATAAKSNIPQQRKVTNKSAMKKSSESSDTNSDSESDSDSYGNSDDSVNSEVKKSTSSLLRTVGKEESSVQSASGKPPSMKSMTAPLTGQKRTLADVNSSSSDSFSDTESDSESDTNDSESDPFSFSDDSAHSPAFHSKPRTATGATVPRTNPSTQSAPGNASVKASSTATTKVVVPPNKRNNTTAKSPLYNSGTTVTKSNDLKTVQDENSKRKATHTLPDHQSKKAKR